MHKAIFMDRDGTVSEEMGYVSDAKMYRPFPWTGSAISRINESGMKAILVTNQSGIGRGYFSEGTLGEVHGVLKAELDKWNAHLDAIYYCPHTPDAGCDCRKPKAGMLLRARQEMNIDLESSYVIGDRYLDIAMGHAVGARTILVLTGDGAAELGNRKGEAVQPHYVAENLMSAVHAIVNGEVG